MMCRTLFLDRGEEEYVNPRQLKMSPRACAGVRDAQSVTSVTRSDRHVSDYGRFTAPSWLES